MTDKNEMEAAVGLAKEREKRIQRFVVECGMPEDVHEFIAFLREFSSSEEKARDAEIAELKESNGKLHRRCQKAEVAVTDAQKVIEKLTNGETPWVSGSLGRSLLAWQCEQQDAEIAELKARYHDAVCEKVDAETKVEELKAKVERLENVIDIMHRDKQKAEKWFERANRYKSLVCEALELGVFGLQDRSGIVAPEDSTVRELGDWIGYGALVDSACRMWAIRAEEDGHAGSEFTVGPCRKVRERWLADAREALKENE